MKTLKQGDKAPNFELVDQHGETIMLSSFEGKKLLVYFYPKANTSGCTTQALTVRDAAKELDQYEVQPLGISPDPLEAQKKFDDKHSLGFPLLSDCDHVIAEAYGAWGTKSMYGKKYEGIIRSSFLIDEKRCIIQSWYKIKPKDTVLKVVAILEEIA